MSHFRRSLSLWLSAFLLAMTGLTAAHQVPHMTLEAEFSKVRKYHLNITLDPRLFLAAEPTTLPPVPASWYFDQTPEQLVETHQKAADYLKKNVELKFGDQIVPLPELAFEPLDGSTNGVLRPDSTEVHLLATGRAAIPAKDGDFAVILKREANVSLLMLASMEGQDGRKPQVIFPGETGYGFKLPGMLSLRETLDVLGVALPDADKKPVSHIWILRAALALSIFLIYAFFKKRRSKTAPLRRNRR